MIKKMTITLLAVLLAGCASLVERMGEPEIKLDNITIDSLDGEGFVFRCDYTAVNPYPLGISISRLSADVLFGGEAVVQLDDPDGLRLLPGASSRNSILFKLPYDSVLRLAEDSSNQSVMPFTLAGEAMFDVSSIPYLQKRTLSLPFSKSFDVPVFRPDIRVVNGKVKLPTVKELAEALITGGLNILRAGVVAGQLALGKSVSSDVFEGVDLDVEILFDLEIGNSGGAPWSLDLRRCGIDTGVGALLVMEPRSGGSRVDGRYTRIEMAAVVNTLEWGAFIVGLAGGSSTGASLRFESSLTFPELPYNLEIPLEIEKELTLNAFQFGTR